MALYTSTPKCKDLLEEKVSLLSLNSDDDLSSGYGSQVGSSKTSRGRCQKKLSMPSTSGDSDFSSDESEPYEIDSSLESDGDDDDDEEDESSTNAMKVRSTQTLVDNIRYILAMPDLCDVVFIVGQQRVPVYGLKAILSTRSRAFFIMFLKHSKEQQKDKKKSKKSKNNPIEYGNRMKIIIDNYDADVFRTFLIFVHCGAVTMDTSSVTGLLCLATEFDIPDLRNACWEFIDRCITVPANSSILMKETFRYCDHKPAQKLRLKILRVPSMDRSSNINTTSRTVEYESYNTETDSTSASIETTV